ncbi:MAG: hypothetical protein H6624_00705 [Bdellovibrionaceae bacterium]|nr:hypothetical protein [Bdellovibrionales bacterium]MCB9082828.1 hypothetical protein [Pseudobdellovibrionaceae bacterium]
MSKVTHRIKVYLLLTGSLAAMAWLLLGENPKQVDRQNSFAQKARGASITTDLSSSAPPWRKPHQGQDSTSALALNEFVKKEATLVGQPDQDPQETLLRLKTVAGQLGQEQFERLKALALDLSLPGDERFLSAYLLSLNQTEASMSSLKSLALAPLPKSKMDARLYDQEIMIRGQALEGLAQSTKAKEHLTDFLRHQDNVPLAEHAQRLIH